eukprot:jgi/Chrzof1/2493/Cz11g17180.t1
MQTSCLQQRSIPLYCSRGAGRHLQSRHVLRVDAVTTDHTARVRGDSKRVHRYVSNLQRWQAWYPGTKQAIRLGSVDAPLMRGAKFELKQDLWGMKFHMRYEILEYDPGRKLVVSGISEYHTQMDQFFFMEDRHDARFTVIRYLADLRLREWRSYLQPVIGKLMAKVPEDALNQLVRTLNSSSSPLLSREFEQEHRRESRAYGSTCTRNSNSNGSQRHTSKDSSSSRWSMPSIDIPKLGIPNIHIPNIPNIPLPSMPKFFTQGRASSSGNGTSSSRAANTPFSSDSYSSPMSTRSYDDDVLDPMGYYRVLGLNHRGGVSQDDIKAAYRKQAMQLHPDRHLGKDERTRQKASGCSSTAACCASASTKGCHSGLKSMCCACDCTCLHLVKLQSPPECLSLSVIAAPSCTGGQRVCTADSCL